MKSIKCKKQKSNKMKICTLVAENDVSKTFKCEDIDVYIAKAVDEEASQHYLVASIPLIPETKTEKITFPMGFATEKERDDLFNVFDEKECARMLNDLVEFMHEQTQLVEDEQKKLNNEEIN
jgi:hypothetical protein